MDWTDLSLLPSTDKQHRHDLHHHDHGDDDNDGGDDDNDGSDDDNDGGDVDSAALSYGRAAIQQLEQVKQAPFFANCLPVFLSPVSPVPEFYKELFEYFSQRGFSFLL